MVPASENAGVADVLEPPGAALAIPALGTKKDPGVVTGKPYLEGVLFCDKSALLGLSGAIREKPHGYR